MIKIYKNNIWEKVTDDEIINAFNTFTKSIKNELIHNNYKFVKEGFYKTFIIYDDNKYPIADWGDVKIFLTDIESPSWVNTRSYQTWAFYHFLYSIDKNEEHYASKNSYVDNIELFPVELPFDDISPNIIFKMIYNKNNSISYEKDDYYKTKIRISNNNSERSYYQGFFNRMTMPLF